MNQHQLSWQKENLHSTPFTQKSNCFNAMDDNDSLVLIDPNSLIKDITIIPVSEIAKQIVLIDWNIFKSITLEDFLKAAWGPKSKKRDDVNSGVSRFTNQFNVISFWVIDEILKATAVKRRANCVSYFIKLAKNLHALNDLHTEYAILSALQSASIYRLESTWNMVPKKHKVQLEKMLKLFSEQDNHSNLRAYMNNLKIPCIPYTGMYVTDLVYIYQVKDSSRSNSPLPILPFEKGFKNGKFSYNGGNSIINHPQPFIKIPSGFRNLRDKPNEIMDGLLLKETTVEGQTKDGETESPTHITANGAISSPNTNFTLPSVNSRTRQSQIDHILRIISECQNSNYDATISPVPVLVDYFSALAWRHVNYGKTQSVHSATNVWHRGGDAPALPANNKFRYAQFGREDRNFTSASCVKTHPSLPRRSKANGVGNFSSYRQLENDFYKRSLFLEPPPVKKNRNELEVVPAQAGNGKLPNPSNDNKLSPGPRRRRQRQLVTNGFMASAPMRIEEEEEVPSELTTAADIRAAPLTSIFNAAFGHSSALKCIPIHHLFNVGPNDGDRRHVLKDDEDLKYENVNDLLSGLHHTAASGILFPDGLFHDRALSDDSISTFSSTSSISLPPAVPAVEKLRANPPRSKNLEEQLIDKNITGKSSSYRIFPDFQNVIEEFKARNFMNGGGDDGGTSTLLLQHSFKPAADTLNSSAVLLAPTPTTSFSNVNNNVRGRTISFGSTVEPPGILRVRGDTHSSSSQSLDPVYTNLAGCVTPKGAQPKQLNYSESLNLINLNDGDSNVVTADSSYLYANNNNGFSSPFKQNGMVYPPPPPNPSLPTKNRRNEANLNYRLPTGCCIGSAAHSPTNIMTRIPYSKNYIQTSEKYNERRHTADLLCCDDHPPLIDPAISTNRIERHRPHHHKEKSSFLLPSEDEGPTVNNSLPLNETGTFSPTSVNSRTSLIIPDSSFVSPEPPAIFNCGFLPPPGSSLYRFAARHPFAQTMVNQPNYPTPKNHRVPDWTLSLPRGRPSSSYPPHGTSFDYEPHLPYPHLIHRALNRSYAAIDDPCNNPVSRLVPSPGYIFNNGQAYRQNTLSNLGAITAYDDPPSFMGTMTATKAFTKNGRRRESDSGSGSAGKKKASLQERFSDWVTSYFVNDVEPIVKHEFFGGDREGDEHSKLITTPVNCLDKTFHDTKNRNSYGYYRPSRNNPKYFTLNHSRSYQQPYLQPPYPCTTTLLDNVPSLPPRINTPHSKSIHRLQLPVAGATITESTRECFQGIPGATGLNDIPTTVTNFPGPPEYLNGYDFLPIPRPDYPTEGSITNDDSCDPVGNPNFSVSESLGRPQNGHEIEFDGPHSILTKHLTAATSNNDETPFFHDKSFSPDSKNNYLPALDDLYLSKNNSFEIAAAAVSGNSLSISPPEQSRRNLKPPPPPPPNLCNGLYDINFSPTCPTNTTDEFKNQSVLSLSLTNGFYLRDDWDMKVIHYAAPHGMNPRSIIFKHDQCTPKWYAYTVELTPTEIQIERKLKTTVDTPITLNESRENGISPPTNTLIYNFKNSSEGFHYQSNLKFADLFRHIPRNELAFLLYDKPIVNTWALIHTRQNTVYVFYNPNIKVCNEWKQRLNEIFF